MLCPRCSSNQNDDIKFCTSCGANLQAVREALETPEGKKFEWSNTWVADMFMSGQIAEMRKLEMERRMGITPEVKRYNEIKAGVIVSSVGFGLAVFLHIFMQGIAAQAAPHAAEILTRIWVVGIIPFMVGIALIINGMVVSKRIVEAQERALKEGKALDEGTGVRGLRPADTNEFVPTNFSVTDQTTRHLEQPERKVR
ncbi:MAG TPA: zinc ribbon domain-containing protein [Pyrinomonadaceae bacterium]|nr:zinc ribbon domain-containing protein [Pyrinomonadaceae bacterium]